MNKNGNSEKSAIKCPHCGVTYDWKSSLVNGAPPIKDARGLWFVQATKCPSCDNFRMTISLHEDAPSYTLSNNAEGIARSGPRPGKKQHQRVVYPFPAIARMPEQTPEYLRRDYSDAVAILEISPRNSAACSRRCLQMLIRKHYGIHRPTLHNEIEELSKSGKLSSDVIGLLDVIRDYGNLGSHPTLRRDADGEVTAEVVDVEPAEAESMIDLLELLFDEAFAKPAKIEEIKKRHERKKAEVADCKPTKKDASTT